MDLTIGQMLLMATNYPPIGTFACNGQLVPIAANPDLYSVMGTQWGGDGQTTFAIPNIPDPGPAGPAGPPLLWVVVSEGPTFGAGTDTMLGEVQLFPGPPPQGSELAQSWLPCDGRILNIQDNAPLFALIGTAFGGDGISTYALPKLAPKGATTGPALSWYMCVNGLFPSRGGDSVTPTPSQDTIDTYLASVMHVGWSESYTRSAEGLALCLAQTLSIATWTALFSLLDTRFGGNGTTNFQLPNRPAGTNLITPMMVTNGYFPPRA